MDACPIKLILFDIGNVILPFNNHLISKRIAALTSFPEEEVYRFTFDEYVRQGLDLGHIEPQAFLELVCIKFDLRVSQKELESLFCDIFSENKEVIDLVFFLKGKYRLGVLSNTNGPHFRYIEGKFPVIRAFDDYTLSFEHGIKKPDPEIYRIALDKAACQPHEALFVDDLERNILPAKMLGMHVHQFISAAGLVFAFQTFGIRTPKDGP